MVVVCLRMSYASGEGFSIKNGVKLFGFEKIPAQIVSHARKGTAVGIAAFGITSHQHTPVHKQPQQRGPASPPPPPMMIPMPPAIPEEVGGEEEEEYAVDTPKTKRRDGILIIMISLPLLITFMINISEHNNAPNGGGGMMPSINAFFFPVVAMSMGVSINPSPVTNIVRLVMGICGTLSVSMFSILFIKKGQGGVLYPIKLTNVTMMMDVPLYHSYPLNHGLQLLACLLGSVYCTWRFSTRFPLGEPGYKRTMPALLLCLFLIQFLFCLLAFFMPDPMILLWVWAIVAWGCTVFY